MGHPYEGSRAACLNHHGCIWNGLRESAVEERAGGETVSLPGRSSSSGARPTAMEPKSRWLLREPTTRRDGTDEPVTGPKTQRERRDAANAIKPSRGCEDSRCGGCPPVAMVLAAVGSGYLRQLDEPRQQLSPPHRASFTAPLVTGAAECLALDPPGGHARLREGSDSGHSDPGRAPRREEFGSLKRGVVALSFTRS